MVVGRIAQLFPKAFRQGVAVVRDDAARAAYNASKAEELARTGVNDYDTYRKLYNQHYEDLGGNTPTPNPYVDGEGILYSLGRTVGNVGAGTRGVANAMGGPAGIAMNAAFLAPMFLSAGASASGGQDLPPTPNSQELELMQQQTQQTPEYTKELMVRAELENLKKQRREYEKQMMQMYGQGQSTSPSSSTYTVRGAFET